MRVVECLLVCDDVGVAYGCQKSGFVDCALYLLEGQILQLDLLEGIEAVVFDAFDFVDCGVGALADAADDLEVVHGHGLFLLIFG